MSSSPVSLSIAAQIDAACDRFEEQWRTGPRPKIEAFLPPASAPERGEWLRALLLVELELRMQSGEAPSTDEYRHRFPQLMGAVERAFKATIERSIDDHSKIATPRDAGNTALVSGANADTSVPHRRVAPASSPIPETLGRFQLIEVLGEGAFGTVYRARDPQLDRDVAIKVPRAGTLQTAEDRQRFLREARAAGHLNHPNICPVHEVGEVDACDYIVMAYIEGKPLSKAIATGKVQARQAASAVRKLALALDEAHRKGIVHRDLKPANIMIDRRGEPIIMDFGLARLQKPGDAQITQSGTVMGSPAYMSPEQARGDTDNIGPASDIYSLGVVLYELLTGKRPFEGTVTEVIGRILHVEPDWPAKLRPNLDPRLDAICRKAMAKEPQARFGSMKELAAALAAYLKTNNAPDPKPATGPEPQPTGDPGQTDRFAAILAQVTSDQRKETRRAVRSAAQQAARASRVPLWTYFAGSGVMGVLILLGILFFVRKGTVNVIINIPIDLKDQSLSFVLDGNAMTADQLAAPIELKPGEHELIVNRNDRLFKKFRFSVARGESGQVAVQDVTPHAVLPEGPPGSPIRWLSYSVHDPKVLPEIADQVNLVHDRSWQEFGEALVAAARPRKKVLIPTFHRSEFPGIKEKLFAFVRENRDVVAGVCFASPISARGGFSPEEVGKFGHELKQEFPGISYWVTYTEAPAGMSEPLPPVPPEVDVIEVANYFDMAPEPLAAKVDRHMPAWIERAKGRPVVLRWVSRPSGWTAAGGPLQAAPGTFRKCAELSEKYKLSGIVFDQYGPRSDNWSPGIDTQPAAVAEIRDVARQYGFLKDESGPGPLVFDDSLTEADALDKFRHAEGWGGQAFVEDGDGLRLSSGNTTGMAWPTAHVGNRYSMEFEAKFNERGKASWTLNGPGFGVAPFAGYWCQFDRNEFWIEKQVQNNRVHSVRLRTPVVPESWVPVKVEVEDGTFKFTVDGTRLPDYVDPAPLIGPRNGWVGFANAGNQGGQVIYRNLRIWSSTTEPKRTPQFTPPVTAQPQQNGKLLYEMSLADGTPGREWWKSQPNTVASGEGSFTLVGNQSLSAIVLDRPFTGPIACEVELEYPNDAAWGTMLMLLSSQKPPRSIVDCEEGWMATFRKAFDVVWHRGAKDHHEFGSFFSHGPTVAETPWYGTIPRRKYVLRAEAMGDELRVFLNDGLWLTARRPEGSAEPATPVFVGLTQYVPSVKIHALRVYQLDSKEESVSLFNGKDLSGWKTVGPAKWSVREGAVFVDGRQRGQLVCDRQFEDFELTGEVYAEPNGNGGICFRVSDVPADGSLQQGGYEFQVAGSQGDPGRNYTGGLYAGMNQPRPLRTPFVKDETWATIRIRVEGTRLRGWVNGQPTFDVEGSPDRLAGRKLTLQSFAQGGEVGYYNFRIRPLVSRPNAAFVPLFPGDDLSAWKGRKELWSMKDGELTGQPTPRNHNTCLFSPREYRDFELRFQVRAPGDTSNSGVQIRSRVLDEAEWTAVGPQCDLGNRGGDVWGGVYGENLTGWLLKPERLPPVKRDEFNDYFIRCVGKRVTIQVNGATTVNGEIQDMEPSGLLAFQLHRGSKTETTFRNIEIRELNNDSTNAAAGNDDRAAVSGS